MKFAFLAASALALSIPAFAQDGSTTPPAEPDTMQTQDGTMTDPATQTPPADPAAAPPAADPMAAPPAADPMAAPADPAAAAPAGDPSMAAPAATGGTMTQGGYAPSAPPMSGAAQPGAQVVFKPSAPVSQAFPPPPPKEEYPVCRGNVQDGCRNPGGQ